jgi:phage gpG-like protein
MGIKRTGDWDHARKEIPNLARRVDMATNRAVKQEAHYYRKMVLKAFKTGGRSNGKAWEPNKASTAKRKKSSKPLIDRGDLRNSIVVLSKGGTSWVGVPSNKRSQDGSRLVSIAGVHEFGKTIAIPVTAKMVKFLMAQLSEQGIAPSGGTGSFRVGSVLIIKIPERSFLRATADAHFRGSQFEQRVLDRIAKILGGIWEKQMKGQLK